MSEFCKEFENWKNCSKVNFTQISKYLELGQDPSKIDPLLKVQKDLDETKIILHKTVDSLLERGEKLDDLVAKSDELGIQSKTFFKAAKKTNSCCVIQ